MSCPPRPSLEKMVPYVYPVFAIIVATGLRNPMLNRNQVQILYCRMLIDLLDDVVTVY
jgi:hypothetical protein